jgi:hypothetical protein
MNDRLDRVIDSAFHAEGEMSNDMLVEKSVAHRTAAKRRMSRPILVAMTVFVLAAGAVTAKVILERQFLFENGAPVGTVTRVQDGVFEVNIADTDKLDKTRTFEVRSESGESLGVSTMGPTTPPANK